MDWKQLSIEISSNDVEKASNIMTMISSGGLYIEDYSDMEEVLPTVGYYDYIDQSLLDKDKTKATIHCYLGEDISLLEITTYISERFSKQGISYNISDKTVFEKDWQDSWKKYFKPKRVGKRLVVRPSWEQYQKQQGDLVVTIDPEMAFGTGEHETTMLCMMLLEDRVSSGETVLDMGCGSGILSVACLLLGAKKAVAVDLDPNAVKVSEKNRKVNGFDEKDMTVYCGNASTDSELEQKLSTGYDIVVANIVSDVIKMQSDMYFEKLKKGGYLIASGIIDTRSDEVIDAVQKSGFTIIEQKLLKGWVALVAQKD